MPKVDLHSLDAFDGPDRVSAVLGPLGAFEGRSISASFGLSQLGANIETLAPGSQSSHRHWHDRVDEIVVVLDGHLTLVEEGAETAMQAGDVAVFRAGDPNGHCLRNDGAEAARLFVVASRDPADRCFYADADLIAEADGSLRRGDGSIVHPKGDLP